MPTTPQALAALGRQIAADSALRAAMTDAERHAEFVAGQRKTIRSVIAAIRSHRDWRAKVNVANPGTLTFFHDEEPALRAELARRWKSHREAVAAAVAAQAHRVAA